MKKQLFTIIFIILLCTITYAQLDYGFNPNSGDAGLDAILGNLNIEAKADLAGFKAELSITYQVPIPKIDYLMVTISMQPAEVYFLLEIVTIAGKSVDEAIPVYQNNKEKGWGFIAKQLGIKPGSPEFKQLKAGTSNKLEKTKGKNKAKKK